MASYTTADQVNLEAVSAEYALEEIVLSPLAGGAANSSFHLFSAVGEFVLTILDNHDILSARRLAAHTKAVFRLGIPTTEVVPTVKGDLIATVDGRPIILKRWIAGEVRDPLPQPLLPEAGRVLARIHKIDPKVPDLSGVPRGTRRLSNVQEGIIPQFVDKEFGGWLSEGLGRVRAAEAKRHRASRICHGDLFADNIIVTDRGHISLLDWETISLDDPLLDLGMTIVGLGREGGLLDLGRMEEIVGGYREIESLDEADFLFLPTGIVYAAMIIAYHRYVRHNIRFPNQERSSYHREMVRFVESVQNSFPV